MKYDILNPPLQCIMTNSTCYCQSYSMRVKGVIIHSIRGKQLKDYIQPSPKDPNKDQLLELIGINEEYTDLNHTPRNYGVNAWIGELNDGTIASVQTLPWDMRSWGCGLGSKGTCNDGWIQITICQNDEKKVEIREELKELIAYLCKAYNLNPNNFIVSDNFKGVPVVVDHSEAYKLGYCQRPDLWIAKFDFTNFKTDICLTANITIKFGDSLIIPDIDKKVEVKVSKLNVRAGPGMNYIRVDAVHQGEILRIIQEKNGFGKLKHLEGWIDLQYTKEV